MKREYTVQNIKKSFILLMLFKIAYICMLTSVKLGEFSAEELHTLVEAYILKTDMFAETNLHWNPTLEI
jgi:hypothetical protein